MKAILGTMTFGEQVFGGDAAAMLSFFAREGGREVDTAYVYNEGTCERIIGEALKETGASFSLATKVNPRISGKLDYEAVMRQLPESLDRMGVDSVDILYLHFPDPNTPIEEPLRACAELYKRELFEELGVSNFPLSLVLEMLPVCDALDCPCPSVYEGVYNALSRDAERELFPALDDLGMRFYAYNPLAGGMLTGRYHELSDSAKGGRFDHRPNYKNRYWKDSYFEAVKLIDSACAAEGVPMPEAAYRWLAHHSSLSVVRGDGVIVGASRLSQLKQNLSALDAPALSDDLADAFEEAWKITAAESPSYFRWYQPGKKG